MFKKGKAKKNRKGRKCQWKESFLDDLVDIIVENEKYRQKLLLTNVKNAKNGQYIESVVKEIQERCTERGKEFPYDVNQTQHVRHVGQLPLKQRQGQVSNAFKKVKIMDNGSTD